MTQETAQAVNARTDLQGKLKEAQVKVPSLEAALARASKALSDAYGKVPIAEFVALDAPRGAAQKALEGAKSDCDKLERGIKALDLAAKREQVVGAVSPIVSAITKAFNWERFPCDMTLSGSIPAESLPQEYAKVMAEHDVKSLGVKVNVGERLIDVKPAGVPSARVPSAGGGGGGFSKRLYATPSGELSQTDVFKTYALEAGVSQERYDAVMADPSNQGISHRGKAVAQKLGFEEVTPA